MKTLEINVFNRNFNEFENFRQFVRDKVGDIAKKNPRSLRTSFLLGYLIPLNGIKELPTKLTKEDAVFIFRVLNSFDPKGASQTNREILIKAKQNFRLGHTPEEVRFKMY